MNFNAFIHLFFILLKFSYFTLSEKCTKATSFWGSLKYPYSNVLQTYKLQGTPVKCSSLSSSSCCNSDLLKEMSSVSELKLRGLSEEKIEFLLTMFSNDSYVLMNMYLNDLENTKTDLNQLFSATYGYNYKVHKQFFYSWFDKMKSYMEGKLHNISQLLDDFFLEMAEKIVKILIPLESGPEVTKCHTEKLIEAKPYQDTDIGLKNKIVRSYPAARLLANAIAVGRDVFKQLMKKSIPTANCFEKFNTGFHCMLCNGLTVKSCPATCRNVLDNCFGSFKSLDLRKLDKSLSKYSKAVVLLASRLDNPFNFPIVNHKMSVQISTAIMNVQNTYPNVKEQIKTKCQKAGLLREKRQASKEFINWQNNNNNNNINKQNQWWENNLEQNMNPNVQKKNTLASYSSKPNDFLSPIAKTIKTKYKILEKYFQKIAPEFCATNAAPPDSQSCWNGTHAIKPETSAEKNGKKKIDKNSDIIIKSAVNQLNEITGRVNDFLSGKTTDPETIAVSDFKLHSPKPESKPAEKYQKTSKSPILEGSGDFEKLPVNEPILPPNKFEPKTVFPSSITIPPNNIKQPPKQQTGNKPDANWQFPSWADGSGDAEIKKPESEDNKTIKLMPWPVNAGDKKSSTVANSKKSSTMSTLKVVTQSTVKVNQLPDDEDLNPGSDEIQQNVKQPVTVPVPRLIVQSEGSGSDPDSNQSKTKQPTKPQAITTTKKSVVIPDKQPLEGSGDVDPKPDVEKERPILPMIPESSGVTTISSKTKKPYISPDEEMPPIEGSGRSSLNNPLPSRQQTITDSTVNPTRALQPDQYPGKIPSEVWIPGIEGVKNLDKDNQKTTPGSQANQNHRSIIATVTALSFLLIYHLP